MRDLRYINKEAAFSVYLKFIARDDVNYCTLYDSAHQKIIATYKR